MGGIGVSSELQGGPVRGTAHREGAKIMELNLNGPDALQIGDKGYNGDTEGAYVVKYVSRVGIDLVHEVTGQRMNKLSQRESYSQDWRWFRDGAEQGAMANTNKVAQAISFAIDEVREFGTSDGAETLFLDLETNDQDPRTELRIEEVGAELENAGNGLMSQFTVKTSDGREWTVRVTPKA